LGTALGLSHTVSFVLALSARREGGGGVAEEGGEMGHWELKQLELSLPASLSYSQK
jgi:hypothetical protein